MPALGLEIDISHQVARRFGGTLAVVDRTFLAGGLACRVPLRVAPSRRNDDLDPGRNPGGFHLPGPDKGGGHHHLRGLAEDQLPGGGFLRHRLPNLVCRQRLRWQPGAIDPAALQGRRQRLIGGEFAAGQPGSQALIPTRRLQQGRRPVVLHAVKLQGENTVALPGLHLLQQGAAAGIIEGDAPVFSQAIACHRGGIGGTEHHAQGHQRCSTLRITVARQALPHLRQALGMPVGAGAPVVALNHQHRPAQHRFTPTAADGRAPVP